MLLSSNVRLFTAHEGGPSPADQFVSLSSVGASWSGVAWTASSDQPWLSVSPGAGIQYDSGPNVLTISVNSALQTEGWTGPTSTASAPATGSSPDTGVSVWTGTAMLCWNGDP